MDTVRHNIRTKKSNFCWLSIDPSLPTPFLLSKAEASCYSPPPPQGGKNCTLSGDLVTTLRLRFLNRLFWKSLYHLCFWPYLWFKTLNFLTENEAHLRIKRILTNSWDLIKRYWTHLIDKKFRYSKISFWFWNWELSLCLNNNVRNIM